MFQSTPLREGRRQRVEKPALMNRVSIHAPARGATLEIYLYDETDSVSIHAPARGATAAIMTPGYACEGFNPRPCARGDPMVLR